MTMWMVVEVTHKIKDADVFGPFATLAEAESFEAGRAGDHAVTEAIAPALARIEARFAGLRGEEVEIVVKRTRYVGVVKGAETYGDAVTVWLDREGDTSEVNVFEPYTVKSIKA